MALGPNEVMIDGEVREIDFFIEPGDTYIKKSNSKYTEWYTPGNILAFRPGVRPQIRFIDLIGTAVDPIILVNKGLVNINTTSSYGLSTQGSKYFRILGNGDPDISHGLKISKTGSGGPGVQCKSLSEEFEVAYTEISNVGFCGIMAKSDGAIGWTMHNVKIHHNIIHDTHGEGMYIGETKTPAAEIDTIEVHHNIIYNTGWDLFQIRHAINDCKVYNNTFWNGGLAQDSVQTKGLQIGDQTLGEYYNNVVGKAHSNYVLQLGGLGATIRNSYFDGDGSLIDPGVFNDARASADATKDIVFSDNWFRNYQNSAFLHYNVVNKTIIKDNVYNPVNSGTEFIKFGNGAGSSNVELTNNVEDTALPRIEFVDEANGDFRIIPGSFYANEGLGFEENGGTQPPIELPPPPPANLVALPTSESTIDLSWTIDNILFTDGGVRIERSLNSVTGFIQILESPILNTPLLSFSDSGLDADTTYFYKVRSYNINGSSIFSNISSATTDDITIPPEIPNAPSNLVATAVTGSQINLSWDDNSDNETGFLIRRSLDATTGYADLASVGADKTFFSDTELIETTTYYYRVRATSSAGNSGVSNTANATTTDVTPPGGTVTTVFEFGKSNVMKGDVKGAIGQVEPELGDEVINNLVITNIELVSAHNTQQEALSNSSIQKLNNPEKYVWVDTQPIVTTIQEL